MITTVKKNTITLAHKIASKLIKKLQSLVGASTVGVRALVINEMNQILLVRHTYQSGWYFPGGGVKKGESPKTAIIRELIEETGVVAKDNPQLMGIFFHKINGVDDYPILYHVAEYETIEANSPEIAEFAWFDQHDLPQETTPATRRRIQEFFAALPASEEW